MMRNVVRAFVVLLALSAAPVLAAEDLAAKFTKLSAPTPAPEAVFKDGEGREMSFAAFRGKWTLINFWATWCAPCRAEMKDLDELEAKLGGDRFVVVALSGDRQGMPVVDAFYKEIGVEKLGRYVDPTMKSARAFRAIGLPTTVLLDPEGREVGRALGPVAWASEASIDYLRRIIGGG